MITEQAKKFASILWNYHLMNHSLIVSDCILVLGSHDTRVAERGAELFLGGWAPLLVFSGGLGRLTHGEWTEPEADKFAQIAIGMGVPEDAIIIENKSTNTGENILFTNAILQKSSYKTERFIVVQKPYMERRSYATFKKLLPDKKVIITSPQILFEQYSTPEIPLEKVIHIMVGDLQRIKVYPKKGFQVYQEIPPLVWQAYEHLVHMGFDTQLIKE